MSQLRGRPFQPGNTFGRGRPKGSRNKINKKMLDLLHGNGEVLIRKAIILALKGDSTALRLCIERLLPVRRDGYVQLPLPGTQTIADLRKSREKLLRAIGRGQITPTEAESLSRIVDGQCRLIETSELEARIERLEQGVSTQVWKEEADEESSDPTGRAA